MAMSLQFRPPTPKFRTPQKKTQPNQQQKVYLKAFTIALPNGNAGRPRNNQPCYNCNQMGHWSREFPYPKKGSNQNQGNQKQTNAKACLRYVHYTVVEEIPIGEDVTTGMFLVNQRPAIVLFDSGASHSFMSQTLAFEHNQKTKVVDKGGYCISSARASISTN